MVASAALIFSLPSAHPSAPLRILWVVSTISTAYMSATVSSCATGNSRSATIDSVRLEIDVIALKAVTIMTSMATASRDKHTSRRALIVMKNAPRLPARQIILGR
ncbi:hypothetical protein D9M72_556110 [compost metagenome]